MIQEKENILFEEIRNGDERIFNQAFDRYYPCMCFYADKILHDFDSSRSIVQQVFVDLWIKREKLHIDSLKSYLYQSVRNAALDVLKHKKAELKYLSSLQKTESSQFADLLEEAELADKINRAIHKLPERCREIFLLCRFEELKYLEIAERLNISVKTVEMQVGIALKRLRIELIEPQMIQLLLFNFKK
jgi:RNA polymerase sigma-70 factor (ECF subfamily)